MDINLQQYIKDATRTESTIASIKVNVPNLLSVLSCYIAAGNLLDDVKKNVFYNKTIDPSKWNSNLTEIIFHSHNILNGIDLESTDKEELTINPRLFHSIIGISTESVELAEAMVTAIMSETDIDFTNFKEEMGDLNWYQAIGLDETNANWAALLNTNINKLKARYPDKFTSDNAINRDLEVERQILETSDPQSSL